MASYTEHLELLKKDPIADGADTFNIQTMLNDNWDKIDAAVTKKADLGEGGKIPASQLPEMNYDPAGSAAAVQANLEAHIGNKSNPHGVTAAQVGARPSTWVPAWGDVTGKPGTFPPSGHTHDASQIKSGILSAARGGTGVGSIAALVQSMFPQAITTMPTNYNFAITGPGWADNRYMSLSALLSLLQANGVPKIYFGSYVGTGTAGSSSPTSVTLPFAARIFMVLNCENGPNIENSTPAAADGCGIMFASQLTTTPARGYGMGFNLVNNQSYGYKSADGKTFSWYVSNPIAAQQLNASGYQYFYLAIQ